VLAALHACALEGAAILIGEEATYFFVGTVFFLLESEVGNLKFELRGRELRWMSYHVSNDEYLTCIACG
jgi:hypothetical protein